MKTKRLLIICLASVLVLITVALIWVLRKPSSEPQTHTQSQSTSASTTSEPQTEAPTEDPFLTSDAIAMDFLPVNPYSRPGTQLEHVNGIVVHYVGNPNTTAAQNREFFASLVDTHERSASSHYIIGLDGEIIQCVPLDEIAYASNERNADTISIECCHPDTSGAFNSATYQSLIKLCAALCKTYGLDATTDIIRHYDVTGKKCPLFYVDNESAWETLKLDVKRRMQ